MSMTVEVWINGAFIAQADVTNETGRTGDDVNTYQWTYQGEGERRLTGQLEHRYGDGAIILADKVIEHVARRYRVVNAYTQGEPLDEPQHCCANVRGHDGPCERPL